MNSWLSYTIEENTDTIAFYKLKDPTIASKANNSFYFNDIIKLSVDKIYQSTEVVDKEIAGYGVINTLLEVYTKAVNNCYDGTASNYDKLILKGLPKTLEVKQDNVYERLLSVCHYVSLLSDSQAILNYKKLKGFSI